MVYLIASFHTALRTSAGTAMTFWVRCSAYIVFRCPITGALVGVDLVFNSVTRGTDIQDHTDMILFLGVFR